MSLRAGFLAALLLCAGSVDAAELRYGSKGLPVSFGNPYMANGSPSSYVWEAMFDGLTRLDGEGNITPALALSWENIEPNAWRFKLREGVAFSNGEAFNAAAVVSVIAWLKTPNGARSVIGNEIRDVAGAEAETDFSVIIRTVRPDAVLPRRMAAVMMVAPKAWADMGPDAFAKTPATTGSFTLKDWGTGSGTVTLEANRASWRPPQVDRLIIRNLPDNPARVQALLSGQIDIAGNINVDDIDMIESSGGKAVSAAAMSVQAIAFRQEDERNTPLKDVRVRQALNYAVDKAAMNEAFLRGLAPPSGQPASRHTVGHDPAIKPYPYDPAKAKALLAEAGYANGLSLRLDVMVDRTPGDAVIYQTVADVLSQVGVHVELRTTTFGSWLANYLSGNWSDFTDGFNLSFNSLPYNDVIRPLEIYSCVKAVPFYCDRDLTAKIIAAGEELDAAKREKLLKELAKDFHDRAPALFLHEMFDLFGLSSRVENFAIINRVPVYEKITLKD